MSWLTDPDEEWSSDEPQRSSQRAPHRPPALYGYPEPDPADAEPAGYHSFGEDPEDEPRSKLRLIALILAAWLLVSIVVLVFLLAVRGPHGSTTAGSSPTVAPSAGASSSASLAAGLPDGWIQQATDDQTDCRAHSYGQMPAFFAKTPCSSVHRVLATTNQSGRTVVIASYIVTFSNEQAAQTYTQFVNADGTGNISDLLREGVSFSGAPKALPPAAFDSRQDGNRVFVAEAAFVSGASSADDATLKSVAHQAVAQN